MRGRTNDAASGLFAWILIAGTFIISAVGCAESDTREAADTSLRDDLIGTWFAYRDNVIENMWTFKRDGTVTNDGWPGSLSATEPALPPYHIEGRYAVKSGQVEVYVDLGEGLTDTLHLRNPSVTHNRLVYTAAEFPVVFLRERAAVGQEYTAASSVREERPIRPEQLTGSWVAFAGGYPANAWEFRGDGTFMNEGWEPLDPRTILIRRTHQVEGTFEVSGHRVILHSGAVKRFDPETNSVADVQSLDNHEIVLYNVVVRDGLLVYTNEQGLPVVYRQGAVTPTNW
jgi:hypothetical protein